MDPITFEIVRHRFARIIDEAVITLKLVSGSEITNEGHDLLISLHRADGSLLLAGVGFTSRTPGAAHATKHILRRFEGQINEGDMFLLNDPYSGAMHTSDIHLISPIFYDGKLYAWSCSFVHVSDIGAASPGGFSPKSRDIYTEGFSSPGLKLIDRGELREDIMDTIRNMVRSPEVVTLDLKSMIACHNVARERMVELIDKYGPTVVDEVTETLVRMSEELFVERLAEFPEGRWEARQYMHVHDEAYHVNLAMTNKDGYLTFDFTGSSPQARYAINSTRWATWGGVFAPLYAVLCYDLTWNEGLSRRVKLVAPEGSIVASERPAPVSAMTCATGPITNMISLNCISKMLASNEEREKDTTGLWNGGMVSIFMYGRNQHDEETIGYMTEVFGGSGGARSWADGVDVGGDVSNPILRVTNVETIESRLPVRYLFRHRVCDSGGAGEYRGGASLQYALVPHDAPDGGLEFSISGKGIEYPATEGISGGNVGSTCYYALVHNNETLANDTDARSRFASSPKEMIGRMEPVTNGEYPLMGDNALYVRSSGGGGYGDPLARDTQAVLKDLLEGVVSAGDARNLYGVVIDEARTVVDVAATESARLSLRNARLVSSRLVAE